MQIEKKKLDRTKMKSRLLGTPPSQFLSNGQKNTGNTEIGTSPSNLLSYPNELIYFPALRQSKIYFPMLHPAPQ